MMEYHSMFCLKDAKLQVDPRSQGHTVSKVIVVSKDPTYVAASNVTDKT